MEKPVSITRIRRDEFYQDLVERNVQKKKLLNEPQLPLLDLSKYVSERVVTPADAAQPECVTCGVCCAYALFVPVTREESERLGTYVELTLDDSDAEIPIDRVLPRQENGNCSHLNGTLGDHVECSIYHERPQVCHDFDAGSDRCHEYRRIYGLEPQLTESEVAAAIRSLERVEKKERILEARIVEAGTLTSYSFSFGDEEAVTTQSILLKIVVFLEDETSHEIHRFDPAEEIWFETDFVPLTLAEARELIASRRTQELI